MNALNSAWIRDASDDASTPSEERLDALFRAHYGRLARVVGRIVHDQAAAEEIAVDVFVKWRGHPAAHGDGAEGWLYRTAVRAALDRWRRARRWSRVAGVLAHVGIAPRTPEELHADDVERRQVRTVLAALHQRQATILLLWAEDLSYAEIAAAVAIQPSSVGSLLRRAQDAFKKEYEARYGHAS
jgi:RNA polymerase sigma-70 factor (ECF subfamily)